MIARKATYLCGALVLAQAGGAGADTTLEERIVVPVSYTHLTLPTSDLV